MNNVLFIAFNQSQISQYSNLTRLFNDYNFDLFQVNETKDNSIEAKSKVKKAIFSPIRLGVIVLSNVLIFIILLLLLLLDYSFRVFGHRVFKRFTIVRNAILYFFYTEEPSKAPFLGVTVGYLNGLAHLQFFSILVFTLGLSS